MIKMKIKKVSPKKVRIRGIIDEHFKKLSNCTSEAIEAIQDAGGDVNDILNFLVRGGMSTAIGALVFVDPEDREEYIDTMKKTFRTAITQSMEIITVIDNLDDDDEDEDEDEE